MTRASGARQPWIAARRRLGHVSSGSALESPDNGFGIETMTATPRQHVERRRERTVVRHGWPGRDHREVVSDDIGNREREHVSTRRERELAALDRGQMLAHGVQLVDVGPLLHQRTGRALLRLERNLRRRQ